MTLFGKRASVIELCIEIEACLVANQRLLYPTCFFRADLFAKSAPLLDLHARLVDIVKAHKGQVVDTAEEADHVVYPPVSEADEPQTSAAAAVPKWIRVIKKRGKDAVLLHRLFHPDSHDEWISNVEIDDEAAGLNDSSNEASGGDVWEVAANWLLDTHTYNEWMNQEDYEVHVDASASSPNGLAKYKKPAHMRKTLDDIVKVPAAKKANMKRSPSPNTTTAATATTTVSSSSSASAAANTGTLKKSKANANANAGGGVAATGPRKRKHDDTTASAATADKVDKIEPNSTATASSTVKDKENAADDLTKNMEAPPAQPHIEEVHVPKHLANVKKESSDYQPYRNGTLIDLDEEAAAAAAANANAASSASASARGAGAGDSATASENGHSSQVNGAAAGVPFRNSTNMSSGRNKQLFFLT